MTLQDKLVWNVFRTKLAGCGYNISQVSDLYTLYKDGQISHSDLGMCDILNTRLEEIKLEKTKTSIIPLEVLGRILRFVPTKYKAEILQKSTQYGPKAYLLHGQIEIWLDTCSIFSREDFKYMIQNPEINHNRLFYCAIINRFDDIATKLLGNPRVDPSLRNNAVVIISVLNKNADMVKLLLYDSRVNPGDVCNMALRCAVEFGYLEIFKLLFKDPRINLGPGKDRSKFNYLFERMVDHKNKTIMEILAPYLYDNRLGYYYYLNDLHVVWLADTRRLDLVKKLLESLRLNPLRWDAPLLTRAAAKGHVDIVKLLLADERVDPKAQNNLAIIEAAKYGHLDIVKILMTDKRVKPSAQNNLALRNAAKHGRLNMILTLLKDPRVSLKDAIRTARQENEKYVVTVLETL